MKKMKKFVFALFFVATLAVSACAADIDGVWGLKFGDAPEAAHETLTKTQRANLISSYEYQTNYSEAIYQVDFFGRKGTLLLRFSRKGLFLARFAFLREDRLPSEMPPAPNPNAVVDARTIYNAEYARSHADDTKPVELSRNFVELKENLDSKYGKPNRDFQVNKRQVGYRWIDGSGSRRITLYESRSISRNDTVMSYEDDSRH